MQEEKTQQLLQILQASSRAILASWLGMGISGFQDIGFLVVSVERGPGPVQRCKGSKFPEGL